ncbi:MAG: putative toxin-antitoxin system toxin component, PIN family [Bacteroidales bacterium]
MFAEYISVVNREKFSKYKNFKTNADVVLNKLCEISVFYKIGKSVDILTDVSDNKFLELALESSADYLITGNILDFKIRMY